MKKAIKYSSFNLTKIGEYFQVELFNSAGKRIYKGIITEAQADEMKSKQQ